MISSLLPQRRKLFPTVALTLKGYLLQVDEILSCDNLSVFQPDGGAEMKMAELLLLEMFPFTLNFLSSTLKLAGSDGGGVGQALA